MALGACQAPGGRVRRPSGPRWHVHDAGRMPRRIEEPLQVILRQVTAPGVICRCAASPISGSACARAPAPRLGGHRAGARPRRAHLRRAERNVPAHGWTLRLPARRTVAAARVPVWLGAVRGDPDGRHSRRRRRISAFRRRADSRYHAGRLPRHHGASAQRTDRDRPLPATRARDRVDRTADVDQRPRGANRGAAADHPHRDQDQLPRHPDRHRLHHRAPRGRGGSQL